MAAENRNEDCLIGLDLGTSTIKGVIIDAAGNDIAKAERRTTLLHPEEGWVEFDPERHYRDVCDVIRQLTSASRHPVAALAMAAASGNTLLTDSEGVPLTPAISWMDQRAVRCLPEKLKRLTQDEVRRTVGWPRVNRFPLAHLAWLSEEQRDVFRAAGHYGMNSDWLLFRLTGIWRMDYSTATTFHLQDQVAGCYHQPFLDLLGIAEAKLSPLTDSGAFVGTLTHRAAERTGLCTGTSVVTGSFDHPAAARAVGVTAPGQLMLSCGTSWVGFFPEMDRRRIIESELLCDPFLSRQGGPWGAIFSVPYIGRTIDWYIDNVIAPDEPDRLRAFDESAARASPGAGGLRIDLRQPPRRTEGQRCNISRAVMEGAARLLNGRLETLRQCGMRFDSAVMVGGPARSPVWPKIVEAITGLRISVGSSHAGAKGAAMLAKAFTQ